MTVTGSEKDLGSVEKTDTDKLPQVTMGGIYGLRVSASSIGPLSI